MTTDAFSNNGKQEHRKDRMFNIKGTVTGRLTASRPNSPNSPKSCSSKGYQIPEEVVRMDFSKLEARILANQIIKRADV